ncbi:hypothetical protein A2U01_0072476, partial [Trifolium medium]|nr:hypothetical protein [Trifolium medium]
GEEKVAAGESSGVEENNKGGMLLEIIRLSPVPFLLFEKIFENQYT